MKRRTLAVLIHLDVDADGAALLPGFPGCVGPEGDECEPPISGLQLAVYAAYERQAGATLDELPTVLDAKWVACTVDEGYAYDPDTSII